LFFQDLCNPTEIIQKKRTQLRSIRQRQEWHSLLHLLSSHPLRGQ